ncbi:Uncharacterised protein [Mycobacteroides abscessus subsp. abscessus]|nr:Uncharacterised protein [Mycobacteroides abscessus subsp. abscessus]
MRARDPTLYDIAGQGGTRRWQSVAADRGERPGRSDHPMPRSRITNMQTMPHEIANIAETQRAGQVPVGGLHNQPIGDSARSPQRQAFGLHGGFHQRRVRHQRHIDGSQLIQHRGKT